MNSLLSALVQFTEYVAVQDDLCQLLEKTSEIISPILQTEILLVSELKTHGFHHRVQSKQTAIASDHQSINDSGFLIHSAIIDLVQHPIKIVHFNSSPEWNLFARLIEDTDFQSGISVSIHGDNQPWGVLLVASRQPKRFSDDEKNFLLSMANMLAEKLRHKREVGKIRDENEALHIANHNWQSTLDALPESVSLLTKDGMVLHSNGAPGRAVNETIPRVKLHDILHPACKDSGCILNEFFTDALERHDSTPHETEIKDDILGKHVKIAVRKLSHNHVNHVGAAHAVAIIEDISNGSEDSGRDRQKHFSFNYIKAQEATRKKNRLGIT